MNERAEAPNANLYGALNGVTHVALIPASMPVGGSLSPTNVFYRLGSVTFHNLDTAVVTVQLFINEGSGTRHRIHHQSMGTNTTFSTTLYFPNGLFVKGPEFLEANMTAGPATTNPNFYSTWVELRS